MFLKAVRKEVCHLKSARTRGVHVSKSCQEGGVSLKLGHGEGFSKLSAGVYILVQKPYLPPPPFWKWYFFPLSRHVVFRLLLWPFCLNCSLFCINFTVFLPLWSFSPLLPFSFPFLSFSFTFSSFSLLLFIFFPPNDIGWYFPPPRGGGYFPIYRPLAVRKKVWSWCEMLTWSVWKAWSTLPDL